MQITSIDVLMYNPLGWQYNFIVVRRHTTDGLKVSRAIAGPNKKTPANSSKALLIIIMIV